MREKILEIIKNKNKKIDPIEIIDIIKPNSTADDLHDLLEELDAMCRDGLIRTASGNTYVMNELITGIVDMHEKGNAHVIVKGMDDIFIPKDKMKGAYDKDLVTIDITDKSKREGRITKLLKRSLGKAIGEVCNINGKLKIKVLDKSLPYTIVVEKNEKMNLVDGQYVHLEYVRDLGNNQVLARIDRSLGHKNALVNETGKNTENARRIAQIAVEYGLDLEFPQDALDEAAKMPKELSKEMISEGIAEGRIDFRDDVIFTIDGKDTKDIDDAISIKILPNGNYQLAVHIADVSHYVKPGSALWREAEKRGNSNYLGNKVLPMLPIELSNGICSLNPNEDRFTESCIMEIDHSGNVVTSQVCKGIIRSKKKMNYDAVEDIIEGKDTVETKDYTTLVYTANDTDTIESIAFQNNITVEELLEHNPDLDVENICGKDINVPCRQIIKNMHALSKILQANKHRRGEVRFEGDESKQIMDEETDKVIDIKPRVQRPAEMLIEDFMVVANETTTAFLEEYNMATYRIHDKPLQKKMDDYMKFLELLGIHFPGRINTENITSFNCQEILEFLKDKEMFRVLNKKMLRTMQKARYSTENIGHFALASKKYSHFTSPIRRFDDLLNHTSISEILKNEYLEEKFIKSWNAYLTTICEHISECEVNSEKCEYAVDDMLKADYMQRHIGEEFEATVDGTLPSSFFVQTNNYIDGRVDVMLNGEKEVPIIGYYEYNENLMAYTRNNRVALRYGDKVLVKCIASDPDTREIDFALVRKL